MSPQRVGGGRSLAAGAEQQRDQATGDHPRRPTPPASAEPSSCPASDGSRQSAAAPPVQDTAAHAPLPAPRVVGLALKKEKRKKHISDKLVALAAEVGIELRFIDKEVPLEAQGPFAAILQKVRKPDWEAALVAYAAAHPEVRIFDMPAATYLLRDRGSMVSFLDGDGWLFEEPAALVEGSRLPQHCRCNVPTNTTLTAGTSYEQAAQQMEEAGLQYPLLAKPLWADGRDGSHALAVVHTPRGLQRLVAGEAAYLQLPVLLQQYVDHGGCLFKVYVLGDTSVRVKRNSLHLPQWAGVAAATWSQQQQRQRQQAAAASQAVNHPVAAAGGGEGGGSGGAERSNPGAGLPPLPDLELMERVSAYPASKSWGKADTAPKGHGVPSPPAWLLQALAQRLRHKTGLSLFNFDVIVPMHLHRRRLHHDSSAAEVASTTSGIGSSSLGPLEQQVTQQQEQQQQQNGGISGKPDAPEEAAVLDLRVAEAQAVASAAAAAAESRPQEQEQAQQQEGGQVAGELLYHLIDINYFPGYEKMPNYEAYMVQFLRSIALLPEQQQPQPQEQPPR